MASTESLAALHTSIKAPKDDLRDIEYYNRTMTQLLGRNDFGKAILVFHSIKENDSVCFRSTFVPSPTASLFGLLLLANIFLPDPRRSLIRLKPWRSPSALFWS